MLRIFFFAVCFMASAIGTVCGIGGGVLIKPVLDAFHVMDVATVSFLSGCTVLAMAFYSVSKSAVEKESRVDRRIGFPLAVGAAAGGLMGKWLFSHVSSFFSSADKVGAVQAVCLLIVTMGTLVYTIYKKHIATNHIKNPAACCLIVLGLGVLSSILGIVGGPVNLIVLSFFFSMTAKAAAENSLYVIFYSQAASLLSSVVAGSIPEFEISMLMLMAAGGIAGGINGRFWHKKITDQIVDRLFMALMIIIILINVYNVFVFIKL